MIPSKTFEDRILNWVTVLFCLCLSAILLGAPGTGDVSYFLKAIEAIHNHGFRAGYELMHLGYPPGAHLFFGMIASISKFTGVDNFWVFKLLNWALFMTCGWICTILIRNRKATLFLLCAVLIPVVSLGYIDIYYAPFLMATYHFANLRKPVWTAIFFTLACLIKPLPWILAPFVFVFLMRSVIDAPRRDKIKIGLGSFLLPFVIVTALFLVFDVGSFYRSFQQAMSHKVLSANGPNLNWAIQYFMRVSSGEIELGHPMRGTLFVVGDSFPANIGSVLFRLVYGGLFCLFLFERNPANRLVDFSILGYLAYCNLSLGVHENHAFILPFLFVFTFKRSSMTWAVLWALILNLNMIYFYGYSGNADEFKMSLFGMDATIVFAFLATVIFLSQLIVFFRKWNNKKSEA